MFESNVRPVISLRHFLRLADNVTNGSIELHYALYSQCIVFGRKLKALRAKLGIQRSLGRIPGMLVLGLGNEGQVLGLEFGLVLGLEVSRTCKNAKA